MVKFFCKNCGYRFETKLRYKPRRCPYCAKEAVEEEQNAQEILNDIGDLLA